MWGVGIVPAEEVRQVVPQVVIGRADNAPGEVPLGDAGSVGQQTAPTLRPIRAHHD